MLRTYEFCMENDSRYEHPNEKNMDVEKKGNNNVRLKGVICGLAIPMCAFRYFIAMFVWNE